MMVWRCTTDPQVVILYGLLLLISGVVSTLPPFVTMDFTVTPKDTAVVVGQQAMLSCSALYGQGPPTVYSWERNSADLKLMRSTGDTNRLILGNGSLVFSAVEVDGSSPDPGRYRCLAEMIDVRTAMVVKVATPEASLTLAHMGDFSIRPANVNVALGDSAMFECRTSGSPAATYSWTKNERQLQASDNVLVHGDGDVLEILAVSSSDAGSYECHAVNIAGVIQSRAATLAILPTSGSEAKAPEFVVRPRDVSTESGRSVTLYCAMHGKGADGNRPRITWLRRGSTLDLQSNGGRYQSVGGSSLKLVNVTDDDTGQYTCRGANSVDVADSEATVTVLTAPYLVTRPSYSYCQVDGDVELQCEIRGFPQPTVSWYQNSALVTPSEYFKMVGHNLRIMGAMLTDAGYYQCVGENSVGKVQSIAQLIVLGDGEMDSSQPLSGVAPVNGSVLPAPPVGLEARSVGRSYVILSWSRSQASAAPATGYAVSVVSVPSSSSRRRSANTTMLTYNMEGLQPNTQYLFTVSAYNSYGRSRTSQQVQVHTYPEAAVPGPVRSVVGTVLSARTVEVTWTIPIETNGNILEYRIFCYSTDQSREFNVSVASSSTSHIVEHLSPYTEYHMRVVAFNTNGQGMPSAEFSVRTFSAKPRMAPLEVSPEVTGTGSILLRWTPPPPHSINGQLTGYKVKYKAKDSFAKARSHTTDADALSYEILDLEPGVTYLMRVGTVNINGTELSSWVEATTNTGDMDESRPPGIPERLTLEPFATEMLVRWIAANDSVRTRGYKLGYGVVTAEDYWVDVLANERAIYIQNLEPITNYIVQIYGYNNAGNGPPRLQQAFTTEEIVDEPALQPPLAVKAEIMSPTSAVITWYDRPLGDSQRNMDGRIYTVKYNALSDSAQRRTQYKNTSELVLNLNNLSPYTEYEFAVMLTKGEKTSIYSLTIRNKTDEAAPSSAPEDLTITKIEGQADFLYISWQPPSQPNGRITRYKIYSNTDSSQPLDRWLQDDVDGNTFNHQFGPVTLATDYYFVMRAKNSVGMSPRSAILPVRTPDAEGEGGFGFSEVKGLPTRRTDKPTPDTTSSNPDGVVSEPSESTSSLLEKSPYLLWIIIACVAVVTIIAISITLVIICNRRKKPSKPGAEAKQGGRPDVTKHAPPDLWIDHERLELNGMGRRSETDNETDEMTSMLQSNFDVSVSLAGDVTYHDDGRFSSMTRSGRPVIIASNHHNHREGMPRAAVSPMSADPSRPLYPRTQFAAGGQHGSTPRVHVGDTSQPSSEYYHLPHMHHAAHASGVGGGGQPPHQIVPPNGGPQSPSHSDRGHPLRSFHKPPIPVTNHVPKHIVKPQPVSAFKMNHQMSSSYQPGGPAHHTPGGPAHHPPAEPTFSANSGGSPSTARQGSQRRPNRQSPHSPNPAMNSPAMNNLSVSREELKNSMMTQSTEQLSAEMANLDCIMQDLNAIKTDFEMA